MFRRKLDLFLWRVHQRLSPLAGSPHHLERIDLMLNILQEYVTYCTFYHISSVPSYMRSCPTRVMPHQVVDVCMETLLRVKNHAQTSLILITGREKNEKVDKQVPVLMSTIHNLLSVFNEVMLQSKHAGLDEFLVQELLESENTQLFVRTFTTWVLSPDSKDSASVGSIPYSQLKAYRLCIVRHYRVRT